MEWTREKPVRSGWYWYRENGKLAMRFVQKGSEVAGKIYYLVMDFRVPLPVDSFKGEWYGPVVPPL